LQINEFGDCFFIKDPSTQTQTKLLSWLHVTPSSTYTGAPVDFDWNLSCLILILSPRSLKINPRVPLRSSERLPPSRQLEGVPRHRELHQRSARSHAAGQAARSTPLLGTAAAPSWLSASFQSHVRRAPTTRRWWIPTTSAATGLTKCEVDKLTWIDFDRDVHARRPTAIWKVIQQVQGMYARRLGPRTRSSWRQGAIRLSCRLRI
jgi:hypothetical protein